MRWDYTAFNVAASESSCVFKSYKSNRSTGGRAGVFRKIPNSDSELMNIMDTLTPKPSFDPKRKNKAVDFSKIKKVNTIKATNIKLK